MVEGAPERVDHEDLGKIMRMQEDAVQDSLLNAFVKLEC